MLQVSWEEERVRLSAVRRQVFIEEQRVPEALEWDDADAVSLHVLAVSEDGEPIGTGRLLPDGHIGRMAVIAPWRGRGVGDAILRTLVEAGTERGHGLLRLNAQLSAIGFYERLGFEALGPVFDDAGIPHRAMRLTRQASR